MDLTLTIEDFVHKRNWGKGNFYSKDFTLEEVNQLIKDVEDAKKYSQLGDVNKLCLDAEKMRSMSEDLDTGGLWQIQQDRLESYHMMLKLVAGILKTDVNRLGDVALKHWQIVEGLKRLNLTYAKMYHDNWVGIDWYEIVKTYQNILNKDDWNGDPKLRSKSH